MSKLILPVDRPPIYIGAGLQKAESEILNLAHEDSLAAQIIGAYSLPEWAGNRQGGSKEVFYWDAENGAAYNAVGLENPGKANASKYLPEVIKVAQDTGQVVIGSIVALAHEKPELVLPALAEWMLGMGADAVEIDVSCRNQDPTSEPMCENVDQMGDLVSSVRRIIGGEACLGVKVAALPVETIVSYEDHQVDVDFIDAINAVGGQKVPIDARTGKPYIEVNHGVGSMSGPIIRDLARQNLQSWVQETSYQVLSIGGIDNGGEVYDRVHNMGAFAAGGVQAFYRTRDPRREVQRWAQEYVEAA